MNWRLAAKDGVLSDAHLCRVVSTCSNAEKIARFVSLLFLP
jgi:hypothetical protein